MSKEKLGHELNFSKLGYRLERWKWASQLAQAAVPKTVDDMGKTHLDKIFLESVDITENQLEKTYGFDKLPKSLPCSKRCQGNPWCLRSLITASPKSSTKVPQTKQPREKDSPVGLQNTANTCWINSALQIFFNLRKFRNAINSTTGFEGDKSLDSLIYLLQVIFAQMEIHPFKAIACESGGVFEKLGMFATQEVMKKDAANNEMLKCVSEFMENTIDLLLAEPALAPMIAPMFTISLTRVAKWQCSECSAVHQYEMSPASCYTMGAYISADQTPLSQCLMDLQAETQTGVIMTCGGDVVPSEDDDGKTRSGCGANVRVDRVVTPKMNTLPQYLIIRNNSLVSEDIKRKLHVVYPEYLDLTQHTLNGNQAHYLLTGVIFHHGHWVKHYSAQVKTDGGPWFSFNDESVQEMNLKKNQNYMNPPENHPNYFSLGPVSAKYKSNIMERVSRGAFIWVYSFISPEPAPQRVAPSPTVMEYISRHYCGGNKNDMGERLGMTQTQRRDLMRSLSLSDANAAYKLINENILYTWVNSEELQYIVSKNLENELKCSHGNIKPLMSTLLRCIRSDKVKELISSPYGIFPPGTVRSHISLADTISSKVHGNSDDNGNIVYDEASSNTLINNTPKSYVTDTTIKEIQSINFENNSNQIDINGKITESEINVNENSEITDIPENSVEITLSKSEISTKLIESDSTETESKDEPESIITQSDNNPTTDTSSVKCNEYLSESSDLSVECVCGPQKQCAECVSKHARHIIFLERLKNFHKLCKKEATREEMGDDKVIGNDTLELWPKIAAHYYMKNNSIELLPLVVDNQTNDQNNTDTDDVNCNTSNYYISSSDQLQEAEEILLQFNDDLVCPHNMLNPDSSRSYLTFSLYNELVYLCSDRVHPATYMDDFDLCQYCQSSLLEVQSARSKGLEEKAQLATLFTEKRRPHHTRDAGCPVYLLDRDFFDAWKTFIRSCSRGLAEKRPTLSNKDFFCKHEKLQYNPETMEISRVSKLFVTVWPDEWCYVTSLYGEPIGGTISSVITVDGYTSLRPEVCSEGCVESQAVYDYEDQFEYDKEMVHIRQVNSAMDIPNRLANTRSMGLNSSLGSGILPPPPPVVPSTALPERPADSVTDTTNGGVSLSTDNQPATDRASNGEPLAKIAKLSTRVSARKRTVSSSKSETNSSQVSLGKLVRASKTFSSTDTIRQVMNFIAERTGVWPMLQTVWLVWSDDVVNALNIEDETGAVLLEEDHYTMTLGALRVRPGDTIYFKVNKEDMEKAAGDGITEYDELPS